MTRIRAFTIATLSLVALGAMGATAFSYSPTAAQARAERTCVENGVRPNTPTWELCLSHVTRAYEWGEASLAGQLARAAAQATEACLYDGQRPETSAFRNCLNREVDGRTELLILGDDRSATNVAHAAGDRIVQQ